MNVQKTIFSLGIAVVLALFINVAFSLVWERPVYPDQPDCYPKYAPDATSTTPITAQQQATCDAQVASYEKANNQYNLVFFVFSLIAGVALLAAGLYLTKNDAISWGVMFAGLFQLIFGSAQYWGELSKVLRLVLLGASLVVLFFIAKKAGWNK